MIGALLSPIPILQLKINCTGIEIAISLRVKVRFWNLVTLGTGLALFSLMIAYALVENFGLGI